MERDCPKCPFTPMEAGLCPKCGGRWYNLESAPKLKMALAKGPIKPREGKAICPACRKNMTNVGLVNEFLRADLCGTCGGVWLDKNEIPLLDKLLLES